MTPPAANPIRYAAIKRKHWANPIEIKPGYWQVEEGSGPKATTRRLAIVTQHKGIHTYWRYVGYVEVWRNGEHGMLDLWLEDRSWKITGPAAELVPMLTDLVQKHG